MLGFMALLACFLLSHADMRECMDVLSKYVKEGKNERQSQSFIHQEDSS